MVYSERRLVRRIYFWGRNLFLLSLCVWIVTCAPSYRDVSTDNGRQAILDQVDNFVTAGDCDQAIAAIQPLLNSSSVDHDALMKAASAYGCKGGVNMPNLISAFTSGTTDIWSTLVKNDYSKSANDGKTTALDNATNFVEETAPPGLGMDAIYRTSDANVFMIFIQLDVIATVISPLGNASSTNGQKSQAITGLGSASDKCHVEVAVSMINDALGYVSLGSNMSSISKAFNTACASLPGGTCPQNRVYSTCMSNAAYQAQGQLLINAIDTIWQ